jgi:DNA-binding SARP family transcriptional activator
MTSPERMERRRPPGAAISLLGRLVVAVDGQEQAGFEGRRVQELMTYLVVHHDRQLSREFIADQLWRDGAGERRKQLRHTVWQLQRALADAGLDGLVQVDPEWMCFVPSASVVVDVLRVEVAEQHSRGQRGDGLKERVACELRGAVSVYRGDLMPSCYEDWCLIERERYRAMYLALLDKLIGHGESSGRYEEGLAYGELVLRHDRASERTHRRMMRLRCLAGDRTGALRQLDQCARALREELDVPPAPTTLALGERIRKGLPIDDPAAGARTGEPSDREQAGASLRALQVLLSDAATLAAHALTALLVSNGES